MSKLRRGPVPTRLFSMLSRTSGSGGTVHTFARPTGLAGGLLHPTGTPNPGMQRTRCARR